MICTEFYTKNTQNTHELIYVINNFKIRVFYIRLYDVRLPENDLKKIGKCRIISEVWVKCFVNTCAFVAIKMFSNALYE